MISRKHLRSSITELPDSDGSCEHYCLPDPTSRLYGHAQPWGQMYECPILRDRVLDYLKTYWTHDYDTFHGSGQQRLPPGSEYLHVIGLLKLNCPTNAHIFPLTKVSSHPTLFVQLFDRATCVVDGKDDHMALTREVGRTLTSALCRGCQCLRS